MPFTDAYGRTLSDDGRYVWDGRAWQPLHVPAPAAPAGLGRPSSGRGLWAIILAVVVAGVIAVVVLAGIGFYVLVRSPSYGTGYAESYQQRRAADEALIRADLSACQSAPASCDRSRLLAHIRGERDQVAALERFPMTPPCLVPEMKAEIALLDRMYGEASAPGGESAVSSDADQLAALRQRNPCSA